MSCHICEAAAAAPDRIVLDDGTWFAYQVADVPGWLTLATKEHVEGPDGLSDEQAAAFGRHVRALGSSVKKAAGAERVHVVYLGESARHFHAAFFPRRADQGPLLANDRVIAEVESGADPAAAAAVRAAIRTALR